MAKIEKMGVLANLFFYLEIGIFLIYLFIKSFYVYFFSEKRFDLLKGQGFLPCAGVAIAPLYFAD